MQGDIYQLEDILRQQAEDHTIVTAPLKPTSNIVAVTQFLDDFESASSPHISVYNEDDISAYLYNGIAPLPSYHESLPSETVTLMNKKTNVDTSTQGHYLEAIASGFDDYYTDAPSVLACHPITTAAKPYTYQHHHQQHKDDSGAHFSIYAYDSADEDECAISTDDEDDDSIGGPATPTLEAGTCRHFHTRHIGSLPGTDQPAVRPVLSRKRAARPSATQGAGATPLVAQPKRQAAVAGSLAPRTTGTIPAERHVDHIEGRMMSWWPLSVEKTEYEWNERFYE